jgi:hypothetical protein
MVLEAVGSGEEIMYARLLDWMNRIANGRKPFNGAARGYSYGDDRLSLTRRVKEWRLTAMAYPF